MSVYTMSPLLAVRITVLVILLLFAVIGYIRGLLKMVLSLVSVFLALILVWMLHPAITNAVDRYTPLRENITSAVESVVLDKAIDELQELGGDALPAGFGSGVFPAGERAVMESVLSRIPLTGEQQKQILELSNLPASIRSSIVTTTEESLMQFADRLSSSVADVIMRMLCSVLSFIVVVILIRVLYIVFGLIGKLPVLGGINRILGALLGVWEGLMLLWFFCVIVSMLSPTEFGTTLSNAIAADPVLSRLYGLALSLGGANR